MKLNYFRDLPLSDNQSNQNFINKRVGIITMNEQLISDIISNTQQPTYMYLLVPNNE